MKTLNLSRIAFCFFVMIAPRASYPSELLVPETVGGMDSFISNSVTTDECKENFNDRWTLRPKWFFPKTFGPKYTIEELLPVSKNSILYAAMSMSAYHSKPQIKQSGWQRLYRKIDGDTGFSADVYVSTGESRVIIAFRGTDDINDWAHGNLETNDEEGQYRIAEELFQSVTDEYEEARITTTGHSLGGGLAIYISLSHSGVDAIVFDPSPRVLKNKIEYLKERSDEGQDTIQVVWETGEVLEGARLLSTFGIIRAESYRYNFLGGNKVTEHSIELFTRCMYLSTQ